MAMSHSALLNLEAYADTNSQLWLREGGSCTWGRRRLGRRSIVEALRSDETDSSELVWIALRLKPAFEQHTDDYKAEVARSYRYGRWARKHTREALIRVFAKYDVQIPARLL